MRPRHVLSAGAAALLLVATVLISPAHAAVLNYSGTIGAAALPEMPVVFIATPTCSAQGAEVVSYAEHPITATGDGTTTFELTLTDGNVSLYLMEAGWDPAAAFPSCLAASNSGNPKTFTFDVVAGTDYVVVVIDDDTGRPGGSYDLMIDGPVAGPATEVTPPTRPPGSIPAPTTAPTTVPETTLPPTTAPPTTGTPTTGTPTTATPTTQPSPTTRPTPTTARPGGVATAPPARPMAGAPGYTG